MAQFHSLPYAAIQRLVTEGQIISGDLYYDNVGLNLYIAATDGALVPLANIILSGNITGTPGPQGPQGPAGSGGGDATSIEGVPINITDLQDGACLVYDAESNTWQPGDPNTQGLCR